MENFLKTSNRVSFSKPLIYSIVAGVFLLVLVLFLQFWVISTELQCVRTQAGAVECKLVRHTSLTNMAAIRIVEPLAADIVEYQYEGNTRYSVEIRSAPMPYGLPLMATYDYDAAQNTANSVNKFLLSSNETNFVATFP